MDASKKTESRNKNGLFLDSAAVIVNAENTSVRLRKARQSDALL